RCGHRRCGRLRTDLPGGLRAVGRRVPGAGARHRHRARTPAAAASVGHGSTCRATPGFSLGCPPEVRMHELKELVAEVPDFPKPGILCRDIGPLLRSRFGATIAALDALFSDEEWAGVDAVAGIESRGFILAAAMAERRAKGFVPIRKKG